MSGTPAICIIRLSTGAAGSVAFTAGDGSGAEAITGTGVVGTLGFSTVGSGLDGSGAGLVLIGSA